MIAIGAFLAKVVAWLSSSAFLGLAGKVADIIKTKSDAAVAVNGQNVGAAQAVDVASIEAGTSRMKEEMNLSALRWGWWGTKVLLFAAAAPPIFHSGMVYLDSVFINCVKAGKCEFWINWRIEAAPGEYAAQEFKIIALIVGYQVTQSIGGGLVGAIVKAIKK